MLLRSRLANQCRPFRNRIVGRFLVGMLFFGAYGMTAGAVDFQILDAQHGGFGGTASSSSSNFRLLGTIGGLAIGSSSGSIFGLRSGFLYGSAVQTPTLPTATPGVSQGSGGGGGGSAPAGAHMIVNGFADPESIIHVMLNGVELGTTMSDVKGAFAFTRTGLPIGSSTFGLWTEHAAGGRSPTISLVAVLAFGPNQLTGILIPPISGFSVPTNQRDPDINTDSRIDLIDFSIMAFWWNTAISPDAPFDLNRDGQLTLADFSILAFYWTGR
jgi:hypothetical protein